MKIAVGFDGSANAAEAVRWAAREALLRDDVLHVIHAWHWPYLDASFDHVPVDPGAFQAAGKEIVDHGVELAREAAPDVFVEAVLATGPERTALVEAAEDADLLVVGTRGTGGVIGLLVGSLADYAVRHAPVPVVVVPASPVTGHGVLVGVDGSAPSRAAAALAVEEAARRGTRLLMLMAWSYLAPVGSAGHEPFTPGYAEDEAAAALHGMVADLSSAYPDVPIEPILECALPARALLEHATRAELVVVGARGLGGFRSLLLGSVTTQLVHHAPVPVLVVRAR